MKFMYTSLWLDDSYQLGSLTSTIDNLNIGYRFLERNCWKELVMQQLFHTIIDKD